MKISAEEELEFGVIEIRGSIDPTSLQASAERKAEFKAAVSEAVEGQTTGIFLMDVRMEFEWFVPPAIRYGTHSIADLDNVLKPLIDALTGPGRPLIDDNQIQAISAAWMDPGPMETAFVARLHTLAGQPLVPRDGLYFVEVTPGACLPLFDRHRGSFNDSYAEVFRTAHEARRAAIAKGLADEVARAVMPDQRTFPRARLGKYVIEPP